MIDSYDKLTIGKYRELLALEKEDDFTHTMQILSILSDIDEDELMNMPLDEYSALAAKTKFVYSEIQRMDYKRLGDTIIINGNKYEILKNARKMTAGQYIDYTNYLKNENFFEVLPFILTVFIIPKGHKYGVGYDIEELAKELDNNLNIRTALCISDFFLNQSCFSIKSSLLYLKWMMKRMMKKETNQEVITKLTEGLRQVEFLLSSIDSSDGFIQLLKSGK